ncbi:MAG TPA: UDP-3-O-acyl-N-acetylglucosamine deacetylase [Alphaproteobacteria bacterium]|nr:UDP-3-O-acyl-N-acetylglucosamine deacetylase [Alphaproteobacteria bacterium]
MQKTLKKSVSIDGIGLHSATAVHVVLNPAPPHHGIIFKRTDRIDILENYRLVPATWNNVVNTTLCSMIGNEYGVTVSTIEHLMAALRALGVDNTLIEIDAGEVPILDGSSKPFVEAIEEAGIETQDLPRRAIRVKRPVTYQDGNRKVTLSPSEIPVYAGQIDYADPTIGSQRFEFKLVNGNFKHDVADCRTFCLKTDIDAMRANGLALGGSLNNAIVVDDHGVMNEGGLHCTDEFIRHKLLDAVGDLALAGGLILGRYEGIRAGHEMNNKLLHALFSNTENYEIIDLLVEFENESPLTYASSFVRAQAYKP